MANTSSRSIGGSASPPQRRIQETVTLSGLTIGEGEWLMRLTSHLVGGARASQDAICVREIALRYRPGRLGIADALDATEEIFAPFAAAGASIEPRHRWEIVDDEDEGLTLTANGSPRSFAEAMRLHQLRAKRMPDHVDLSVDAVLIVDASADDRAAAVMFWLALALPAHDW
ncbi:MAG TPA: hypothetical protein VE338_18825 [Ktedonobacterales bacterium]|nr:hypothetical protein [Ktedonobacterales bacterium]